MPETLHRCEHTSNVWVNCSRDDFRSHWKSEWAPEVLEKSSSWKIHDVHGVTKSPSRNGHRFITRTQEPDDHDHSDDNGTSVQLQEFKVVDSLSCCPVCDWRRAKYKATQNSRHVTQMVRTTSLPCVVQRTPSQWEMLFYAVIYPYTVSSRTVSSRLRCFLWFPPIPPSNFLRGTVTFLYRLYIIYSLNLRGDFLSCSQAYEV